MTLDETSMHLLLQYPLSNVRRPGSEDRSLKSASNDCAPERERAPSPWSVQGRPERTNLPSGIIIIIGPVRGHGDAHSDVASSPVLWRRHRRSTSAEGRLRRGRVVGDRSVLPNNVVPQSSVKRIFMGISCEVSFKSW